MTKTSTKQLILLIFAAILIVLVYLIYPSQKKQFAEKESIVLEDENVENTFRDILYSGITKDGNPFEIGSEYAEIRGGESNLTYMKDVTAYFHYKNRVVIIKSENAVYNRVTNDMLFDTNVEMIDGENKAWSDNLDAIASEDFIYLYNNIKFYNKKTLAYADKIEIDLLTKTSRISMYTPEGKVRIKFIE